MDALTNFLDSPRARGAFLMRVTMAPPWSVEVRDEAPLAVVAVTTGSVWYAPASGDPVVLRAGDVLLVRGPDAYRVADSEVTPTQAVIHPGGRCETPTGESLELPMRQGVRTWGNAADGTDAMLIGTYESAGEVGSRILDVLPREIVIRGEHWRSPLVEVLGSEISGDGIGQASLLDRLLDALTVSAIQHWLASADSTAPGWLRAGADDVVRAALELVHEAPQESWTVASLAHRVGVSRAGLARRFTDAVGEPPMSYLAGWRLALAADQLLDTADTVSRIARDVGYSSPFTFSTAFKRHYGASPQAYRQRRSVAL